MSHRISFLSFFCMIVSSCACMEKEKITPHQLDFTTFNQELGMQAGEREARYLLPLSKDSKDLFRPLFNKLDFYAGQLKERPDPEIQSLFQGFVTGFACILFRYNSLNQTEQIQLDPVLFKELVAKRQNDDVDARTQKSRKELIESLTAALTKMKLLTLTE